MLDSIAKMLAGPLADQIARRTGLPKGMVEAAVVAAVPMLLGALAKNARSAGGAASLHGALERDHDGAMLDDLDGYVDAGGNVDDGEGILRHTLGERRAVAEQAVAAQSGLDLGDVSKLLPMLAPLVMGALGREQTARDLGPDGVADLVREQQREAVQRDAAGLGGMAALLDRDGDGGIIDDVGDLAGLAARFLQR